VCNVLVLTKGILRSQRRPFSVLKSLRQWFAVYSRDKPLIVYDMYVSYVVVVHLSCCFTAFQVGKLTYFIISVLLLNSWHNLHLKIGVSSKLCYICYESKCYIDVLLLIFESVWLFWNTLLLTSVGNFVCKQYSFICSLTGSYMEVQLSEHQT
jgi:hypothetical protein